MGTKERAAYSAKIAVRYAAASRDAKSRILDEYCKVCDVHRKHAMRHLSSAQRPPKPTSSETPPPRRKGRAPSYAEASVTGPIKRIWLAAEQPWRQAPACDAW